MAEYVRIINGKWRSHQVTDTVLEVIKPYKETASGNKFVTCDLSPAIPGAAGLKARINVEGPEYVVPATAEEFAAQAVDANAPTVAPHCVAQKTDEEIMDEMAQRFQVLDVMTKAAIAGDVRGMIVTGPPGVGKSYGVEQELEKTNTFAMLKHGELDDKVEIQDGVPVKKITYTIVKGSSSALGLYATLFSYSDAGNVVVFDDCDNILQDELCLNILKGALDSSKKRRISWNASSSRFLDQEGIPSSFLFRGSVIFITNVKFDNIRSKKTKDHLEAIQSRCHYLDLEIDTPREKLLRIKQVMRDADLFQDYKFDKETEKEIIDFMEENKNRLRELSLRMALKLADLVHISKSNWKMLAKSTCMR